MGEAGEDTPLIGVGNQNKRAVGAIVLVVSAVAAGMIAGFYGLEDIRNHGVSFLECYGGQDMCAIDDDAKPEVAKFYYQNDAKSTEAMAQSGHLVTEHDLNCRDTFEICCKPPISLSENIGKKGLFT